MFKIWKRIFDSVIWVIYLSGTNSLASNVTESTENVIANTTKDNDSFYYILSNATKTENRTTYRALENLSPRVITESHKNESDILGMSLNASNSGDIFGNDELHVNIKHTNISTLILNGPDYEQFGLAQTMCLLATAFLSFAVLGYITCILWRKYLLSKYGDGRTLITDDVHDVSDLRYFEI